MSQNNDGNYIRFDWAIKRLLRNKANHVVLEGFLSTLLGHSVKIRKFLESESNQEDEDDKYNRVDILAEDENKALIIIEVQNSREYTYFHRMLYGTSKAICDYIELGNDYAEVRKLYSVNIVYFDLGQGSDYVYHGKTTFQGLHEPHDTLRLSKKQSEKLFGITDGDEAKYPEASQIFPEYYVLRVNDFNKVATEPLDEWIKFLKTGKIDSDAKAAGLPEARERLRIDQLTKEEQRAYVRHIEGIRNMQSCLDSSRFDGYSDGLAEGRAEGRAEGMVEGETKGMAKAKCEIVLKLASAGMTTQFIAQMTGLSEEEVILLTGNKL